MRRQSMAMPSTRAMAMVCRDLEGLRAELAFERIITKNSSGRPTVQGSMSRVPRSHRDRRFMMTKRFKVGDRVTWNSEAGQVGGTIIKVHTSNVVYKGYMHHASDDNPQYEIRSSRTEHIAMHKGQALKKTIV